ncbi:hypothetical protein GW916_09345 [bacterium]|nr:hypothetical protein [bacterium]
MKNFKSIVVGATLALSGASTAQAMEPLCAQAALIAGAAFKSAGNYAFQQFDVKQFSSTITGVMVPTRTDYEKIGEDTYIETYLIEEENLFTESLATVVIKATSHSPKSFCEIKSITAVD